MTTLIHLSGQPLVHALGWTLLHFCWQGTVVAAVLWCVLGLLGGRRSRARYGAACLALALMVALPLGTFARIGAAELRMRAVVWSPAIGIDPGIVLRAGMGVPAAPWPLRIAVALDHSVPWVLAAWFAGVILFAGRLNLGLMAALRMKSAETEAPPADLQRVFDALRIRLGVARAVGLMHSARVHVPTVIGWLRPVVLIPVSCLTGLSAVQIEVIFAHELAHVLRHDYLVSVLQSVVEALLFYHPAVWWVSRQVRRERECCCDEIAVAVGGDRLAYARALSYLEERRACFPEFVLGANGGVLKMRIRRLLGCKEDTAASQLAALTVLAVIVGVAGVYVVAVARAQSGAAQHALSSGTSAAPLSGPATQEPAQPGVEDLKPPYRNWVDEDVVWIINPEERAAFLRLTNDAERDTFIESFWELRNPAPGSPGNRFREEHYKRIAYANEHFAASVPGWQTDRGRTYIVYGPPYSIDAHPAGGQDRGIATNLPFEVWQYRPAEGAGQGTDIKFVDQCQCGDYRLVLQAPSPAGMAGGIAPVVRAYAPRGPVRVSSGVMAGNLISRLDPVYPADAKAAHVQGMVVLHAVVSKAGAIESLSAVSGPEALQASSLDAVRMWRYRPYLLNGEPVEVDTEIMVHYAFGGNDGEVARPLLRPISMLAEGEPPPPPPADAPPAPGTPIRVSGGLMAGNVLSQVDPVYPAEAKAAGVQGAVVLRAIVSKTGSVEHLTVVSGPPELTVSALDAVRQWMYKPFLLNGEPVEVQTTITVNYTLAGSAESQGQPAEANDSDVAPKSIGGGVSAPVLIYSVDPEYTPEAKKAKTEGSVLVNLWVDEKGSPTHVRVLRGIGNGLDEKAVEAVKQYKFKPAMEEGKPVLVQVNLEIQFRIF